MNEAEQRAMREMLRAALELLEERGWVPFGKNVCAGKDGETYEFYGEGEDGLPIFERILM